MNDRDVIVVLKVKKSYKKLVNIHTRNCFVLQMARQRVQAGVARATGLPHALLHHQPHLPLRPLGGAPKVGAGTADNATVMLVMLPKDVAGLGGSHCVDLSLFEEVSLWLKMATLES